MQIGPEEPSSYPVRFEHVVHVVTRWIGSTPAIVLVLCLAAGWLLTRPLFASRQDWQDAVLVPVTLLTFVLIFFLQRSQNKAMLALQLKLNEVIASQRGASNRLIDLENLSEEEVHALHKHYQALATTTKAEENPGEVHSIEEVAPSNGLISEMKK